MPLPGFIFMFGYIPVAPYAGESCVTQRGARICIISFIKKHFAKRSDLQAKLFIQFHDERVRAFIFHCDPQLKWGSCLNYLTVQQATASCAYVARLFLCSLNSAGKLHNAVIIAMLQPEYMPCFMH